VTEKEFRYPGPKPASKEITLMSLADSCEAASRSIEKPTASKIETLVWEIIRRKIREGQLDNSEISLEELSKIRLSFTKSLTSMLHARISYPADEENKDEESLLFKTQKNKSLYN
jgi:membrane-associated HD superfamily phosphohydrolase